MTTQKIRELSEKFLPEVTKIRHQLHMQPELAYEEHRTSRLIQETLASIGIPYTSGLAGTGVIGIIEGPVAGKTVMLRADMDALPVQENTGLEYSSQVENKMHACGHDGHVSGLLGAAMILNELRDQIHGKVKLVFQPAEEVTNSGAAQMIRAGALENPHVDAAFGCHLWGELKEGIAQVFPGPMMAACVDFKFTILGRGGHGALPHLTLDPISMGAQAITYIQNIISRRTDPMETAVLTIGSIHGGETGNVIPDKLEAEGMIRTFNEQVGERIIKDIENILKGITQSQNANYKFEYDKVSPAVINDPKLAELATRSFTELFGKERVEVIPKPTMVSEDFSHYGTFIPSMFIFIGIAKDGKVPILHHNPKFQWEDKNLSMVSAGFAKIAIDYLDETWDKKGGEAENQSCIKTQIEVNDWTVDPA
ncbi:MAG: amidohydrolase [Holophaga sp.]